MVIITGSVDEINRVAKSLNPEYPRQNLEELVNKKCAYVMNGVTIELNIIEQTEEESDMNENLKEVRFDKWCPSCKHYPNKFADKGVSNEFQHPCGECLEAENAMREGTEKPEYWEKI